MSETETNGQNLPAVVETAVPQRDPRAGTAALAEMSQAEFDARLLSMARGRDRLKQIHQELMSAETDYGVIPGTGKPTLLKPGAEKLLHFYRLCSEFVPVITYGDGEATPWITVVTECRLHLGELEGPIVNTGHGAANSWEKRYRRGGAENVVAFDLLNTLIKMSIKRAMVDAALRATATSGVYSQDMEDLQQAPERAPKADPEEVVVCSAPECGAVLSRDEIIAAGRYFGGTPLCVEHGKRRRAAEKAEREAIARVEAAEAEMPAAAGLDDPAFER